MSTNELIAHLKKITQCTDPVSQAFGDFVGHSAVTEHLTYPVMWCKDHGHLESAPGCMMNQARRSPS